MQDLDYYFDSSSVPFSFSSENRAEICKLGKDVGKLMGQINVYCRSYNIIGFVRILF